MRTLGHHHNRIPHSDRRHLPVRQLARHFVRP